MIEPKHLPDYYPTMYLDGYTPFEIMLASQRTMAKKHAERQAKKRAEKEFSKNIEKDLQKVIETALDEIEKAFK